MYPDYDVKCIHSFRDMIHIMATEHGSDVAFSCTDRDWTYGELVDQILRLCTSLARLQQSKVQLQTRDAVKFVALYLATVLVGKVAIFEENSPLEDTVVVTDADYPRFITDCSCSISTLPEPNPGALCTILHSSGTESAPKGIMLSQENLCSNVVAGLQKCAMDKEDRLIHLLPYSHAFGLVCDLLAPLLVGAKMYILPDQARFLAALPRIKPTSLNVPPVIAEAILRLIQATGNPVTVTGGRLRKMLCGGAPLRASVSQELRRYGIYAYGCYGLSEASPCVAVNRDNHYKDGSAGIPLNCNQVSIADDGEILITGSNIMLGYYNDPDGTKQVIRNGTLHTGDLGYIDGDGFLFITGRKGNLIVFSDGTKCSPEILEEQITANTAAEEALVYQGKHEMRSSLCAKIYLPGNADKAGVRNYVERLFAPYALDEIELTNTPLPRNKNGKIRRLR